MCSSCGCGIPEETHNDSRNILFSQLTAAAEAQGIAVNDVVNNMHAMTHQSHKVDQKPQPAPIKDAKTKMLKKTVMSMSEAIIDALEKGQRRDETGKFNPGKDNVHSHKMGTEIITHSHEGVLKHTHPTRKYGPSFNHR